ncbi:MAG: hypothetical protein VX438_10400 [Planctomycetota bacterium]|nr:hypothetical protein [Planctomycetota bacterium]
MLDLSTDRGKAICLRAEIREETMHKSIHSFNWHPIIAVGLLVMHCTFGSSTGQTGRVFSQNQTGQIRPTQNNKLSGSPLVQQPIQQNNSAVSRQPATNNINSNRLAANPLPDARKMVRPGLPRPFPELSESHILYLNQLLNYWETNSNKIKRYQCKFTNWTYNSMQVPITDPSSNHVYAQTISVGTVKFAAPDKGLFDSSKVWTFDKQRYAAKQDPFNESPELRQKWHCDGTAIYEYLYTRKELVETPIPKEMQGERIVDGPLPFLFGAKADELKNRYWIRVITPKDRGEKGEYWLEAYPKFRQDAANFQKVEIILEKKDFLPAVLTLFSPEHDLQRGRIISKQTIKFDHRKIWENPQAPGLAKFFDDLSNRPGTPFGWKRSNTNIRDTSPRVGASLGSNR